MSQQKEGATMSGYRYSNVEVAAPMIEQMSRNGLDDLEPLNAVSVRQELQLRDALFVCCKANKYRVSTIPIGLENKNFDDQELNSFPTLFDVRENSTLHCRFCWANRREFTLGFFPPGTPQKPKWPVIAPMVSLHRPFKYELCGRLCGSQQIHVSVIGEKVGHVEQEYFCSDSCCLCVTWAKSFDATGQPVHSFETDHCGKNCCAPSCCNPVFTINIRDAHDDKPKLGELKNIWPGCNCRGLCLQGASNHVVLFPRNATKEEKALLMGSLILHDFVILESSKFFTAAVFGFATGLLWSLFCSAIA